MVLFAIGIAIQNVTDAAIPTKGVINAQTIIHLCALIEVALMDLMTAVAMEACDSAVFIKPILSN